MRAVERAPVAVVLAGLVMAVGGFVSGEKSVGEGCGSGFDPQPRSSQSVSEEECLVRLEGRGAAAWQLIVVGVSLTVGGLYAGAKRRVLDEDRGGPAGAGKPWRVDQKQQGDQ